MPTISRVARGVPIAIGLALLLSATTVAFGANGPTATIRCLSPNGGFLIDGTSFTVLEQGKQTIVDVRPEGSVLSLWSCGWDEPTCRWLDYEVQPGTVWGILVEEPAPRIVMQPRPWIVSGTAWRSTSWVSGDPGPCVGGVGDAGPGWTLPGYDDDEWFYAQAPIPTGYFPPGIDTSTLMWDENLAHGRGLQAFFRYPFSLAGVPASAPLRMWADDNFELYVNGVLVFADRSGGAGGWPTLSEFWITELDIAGYLRAGDNVIAARAWDGAWCNVFDRGDKLVYIDVTLPGQDPLPGYATDFEAFAAGTVDGQDGWWIPGGSAPGDGMIVADGDDNQVLQVLAGAGWGEEVGHNFRPYTEQYVTLEFDFQVKDSGSPFWFTDFNRLGLPDSIYWFADYLYPNVSPGIGTFPCTQDTWYRVGIEVDQSGRAMTAFEYDGAWMPVDDFGSVGTPADVFRFIFRGIGAEQRLWIDNLAVTGCDAHEYVDMDCDLVGNATDNCPRTANSWQSDLDADGRGDFCDPCPADRFDLCDPLAGGSVSAELRADERSTVETPDGSLSLDVDPGDLPYDTTISVTEALVELPPFAAGLAKDASAGPRPRVYDLHPEGLLFDNPVVLTIRTDVSELDPALWNVLDIFLEEPTTGTMEPIGAACGVAQDKTGAHIATCSGKIMHFSYVLIAPARGPVRLL